MSARTISSGSSSNPYLLSTVSGALLAAVGNVIVFIIASALSIPVQAAMPPANAIMDIPIFVVVFMSVFPAIGANVLYYLLNRFTGRGRTIFVVIAAAFLLFSFFPLAAMPAEVATGSRIVLGVMHLVAGAAIIGAILRFHR